MYARPTDPLGHARGRARGGRRHGPPVHHGLHPGDERPRGRATLRFNFPYIESGRRSPDRAPCLLETWRAAFEAAARSRDGRAGLGRREVAAAVGSPRWPSPTRTCPRRAWCSWAIRCTRPASRSGSGTSICTASRCRCCSSRARAIRSRPPRCWTRCPGEARRPRRPASRSKAATTRSNVRGAKRDARAVTGALAEPVVAAHSCARRLHLMPRKNRRDPRVLPGARGAARPRRCTVVGTGAGFDVRHVGGQKAYRCPGCDHIVRAGVWHLVVVPEGDADARRHWHTECWRSELRRQGRYRRAPTGILSGRPGYDAATCRPHRSNRDRGAGVACIPVSESKRLPCDLCGHPMEPEHAHYRCPAATTSFPAAAGEPPRRASDGVIQRRYPAAMADEVRARMWESGGRHYARILDTPAFIEVTGVSRAECLAAAPPDHR